MTLIIIFKVIDHFKSAYIKNVPKKRKNFPFKKIKKFFLKKIKKFPIKNFPKKISPRNKKNFPILKNFPKIKKNFPPKNRKFFGNFPIGTSYLALDGTVAKF